MGLKNSKYIVTSVGQNQECCLDDLTLCEDPRSILGGRVVDCRGQPVAGALVSAYKVDSCPPLPDPCHSTVDHPLGRVFTDQDGRFVIIVCVDKGETFLLDVVASSTFARCKAKVERCDLSDRECCHPQCDPRINCGTTAKHPDAVANQESRYPQGDSPINGGGPAKHPNAIVWRRNNKLSQGIR